MNNNVYGFDNGTIRRGAEEPLVALPVTDAAQQLSPRDAERTNISRPDIAKKIYDMRRLRDKFLPQDLLAEPGWDILLFLYWNGGQQRMNISAVCASAGVPPTTALRWVQRLIETGLVEKAPHPTDNRVSWLSLSKEARATLDAFVATVAERGWV